jgi:hypothetical protein
MAGGCPKRGVWGETTPTCGGCFSPRIPFLLLRLPEKVLFGQPADIYIPVLAGRIIAWRDKNQIKKSNLRILRTRLNPTCLML